MRFFPILTLQHPFATSWPSSPRWEACHWILRSLCSPTNPVPLPPKGDARESSTILPELTPLPSAHSPTAKRGEGGGASHQRGPAGRARTILPAFQLTSSPLAELATCGGHPLSSSAGLLHGKASHLVLRSLCSPTNQVRLPPLFRGQNKPLYAFP